jgi:glycosyltransferase involved in cell wall biosynthesis
LIQLCYNGMNTEVFHRRKVNLPPELQGGSLIVGVACALRPEKGLPTLVRGFAIAHGKHPGMRLLIVGSGAMLGSLEQLSCELGVRESCLFVPSTADVTRWLSSMDVFVLPSLSEALSNSLIEAMACGCAPIASDVGGNPELVAHGKRGLLFPAGDSDELARHLVTFAEDEEFRRRCGEDSRDFVVRNFSLRASVQRMTKIYSETLARKSRCGCDAS